MKFLSKLSRLGLIFVGIQTILVLLIPLWAKLYKFPCNRTFAHEVHHL